MIAKRHQVVMLADRNSNGDPPWYRPTYNGLMEETPYTFNPPSELTDPANWPTAAGPTAAAPTGSLFLMNHWSPSTAPAEPNLAQSARGQRARRDPRPRARSAPRSAGGSRPSIAVDQFTAGDVISAVRELNRLIVR